MLFNAGVLGLKEKYKIENPNVIHICGNCKTEDNFTSADSSITIFRCQKCGYINI